MMGWGIWKLMVSFRAFQLLPVVRLITKHVLLINSKRHETPPAIIADKSAARQVVPRWPFCSSPSGGICKQNPVWNGDAPLSIISVHSVGSTVNPTPSLLELLRGGWGAGPSTCMLTSVCMCAHSVSLGWCHIYVLHNIPSGWHAQGKKKKKKVKWMVWLCLISRCLLAGAHPVWTWAQRSDFVYI